MERRELIARLASEVASVSPALQPAARMCKAVSTILGADGGSVTIDNAGTNRMTLCATDEVAARLESAQDVLGEGPCIDAFLSGEPVVADLGTAEKRWPMYADRARPTGAQSLFALPMQSGSSVLGVVSLYTLGPKGLIHDLADAKFLADALGAALMGDVSGLIVAEDHAGWQDRSRIHQATGIVVAQLAVPESDALAILRAHAFADGTDLVSVARAVVARDLIFTSGREGSTRDKADYDKEGFDD